MRVGGWVGGWAGSWTQWWTDKCLAQNPVLRISQSALHFTPWQTCLIWHHLDFSVKHPATLQLMHKTIRTQISTYVYNQVHIYTAEWTGVM